MNKRMYCQVLIETPLQSLFCMAINPLFHRRDKNVEAE